MGEKPEALWVCVKPANAKGRRTKVFRTRHAARVFCASRAGVGYSAPERATWGPES